MLKFSSNFYTFVLLILVLPLSQSQHENKENTEISSSPRPVLNPENKKMLPCVIKWNGGGKDVALAGSFNNWRTLPMVKR